LTLGVDVGGTFTDILVSDSSGLKVLKLPTTPNPARGIVEGLRRLGPSVRRATLISHATTLATNALLTRTNLARTALVTNEGFRDVLEIGRQRRPELYDLKTRRPPPLVERRDRLTASCRVLADGSEFLPLPEGEADSLARKIVEGAFDSVAICFLHSYRNGAHEELMRTALVRNGFRGHVSISSEVDSEYREYERTSTTVVNAALSPLMTGYLSSLVSSLSRSRVSAPVYVMNSDGGTSTVELASARPATVIESGPAAGVIASRELARELSLDRVLTFDMGGTTAKAGTVINGEAEITREFEAAGRTHSGRSIRGSGYPVRGEFIDLAEVSAGGGTIASVDDSGSLRVGPDSAGSVPGPACYGRGGTDPTVTDANVVLGRLNPKSLLGGAMPIKRGLALQSMKTLSKRTGLDAHSVATGILRLVNNSMARAISMVTVERGRDPRDFVMVAFGGAGPLQACDLAEEMGISQILVPAHAGLFSAYGLLAGELTRTFSSPVMEAEPRLEARFRRLEARATEVMKAEGLGQFRPSRHLEARYSGQSHEILLPFHSDTRTRRDFDRRHRELYGYSLPDKMEVVNIRVRVTASSRSKPVLRSVESSLRRRPSRRQAWVGARVKSVNVLTRGSLRDHESGNGPIIIEDYDSTLVVNQSWRWSAEPYGVRIKR
jgi:N-methylhydantoinase A